MAHNRCKSCDTTFVGVHCDVCGAAFCPHCWTFFSGFLDRVMNVCRCLNAEYYSTEAVEVAGRLVQRNGQPCPISWISDGLDEQRSVADITQAHRLRVGMVNVKVELDAYCEVRLRCAPCEFVKYVRALECAGTELRQ